MSGGQRRSPERPLRVDRANPLPLHVQVKQALKDRIVRRTWKPGDLVPGDLELCDQFGVSRTTVRQGLAELAHEGWVVRGRRTIEAVAADARQARLLHIRKGAPLLFLQSVSYLADGRPIEFYLALHRGDRSRFEVELMRGRQRREASATSADPLDQLPPGGGPVRRRNGR